MPTIDADGCPIHVEVEGRDNAPALMLSNSLGTDLHMWDDQAGEFAKHFRLVRYDRRGHGKSGVTARAPISMEQLGRDVLAILDAFKIKKTNWCGLSMGGMVGQWLGANAPGPRREAHPVELHRLLPRQGAVERPHQDSCARKGLRISFPAIWSAGSPNAFRDSIPQ